MDEDVMAVPLRPGAFIALLEYYKFDEHLKAKYEIDKQCGTNEQYYYRILEKKDEAMKAINPMAHEHDLLSRLDDLANELYKQVNGPLLEYIIKKNPAGKATEMEIRQAKAAFTYMCTSKFLRLHLCGQNR